MVSLASCAVAVLPVPIAHTGSYAMTMLSSSSLSMSLNAATVWRVTTSSVLPLSRSSRVSPTHTMGLSPAASAAFMRALTVSSVSPKYCLLSLCPMMTYSTPSSTSISALISPVKAPFAAQCTFSAPTLMLVPAVASTAAARSVYGVQMTTSHAASLTSGIRSATSAFVCATVLFIFQLPAMIGLRIIFSFLIVFSLLRRGGRRGISVLSERHANRIITRNYRTNRGLTHKTHSLSVVLCG